VEFVDELLVIVSLPLTAPEVAGLNCTVSVTVCFGLSVIGKLAPETVKPVPDTVAAWILSEAVPLEVSVTDCVDEEPTVTLPKLKLEVLSVNVGVVVTPVPLRLTTAVGFVDELLLMVSLPETAPDVVGLNCTVSVTACFGFSVTGKLAPETVNPSPLMAAAVTFTAAVPVEVKVTD
jgi:hypothetical protein